MLADYEELRERRLANLPRQQAGQARLVFSGLQQRLLSSVAAFAQDAAGASQARWQRAAHGAGERRGGGRSRRAFATEAAVDDGGAGAGRGRERLEALLDAEEEAAAAEATLIGAAVLELQALARELAAVDDDAGGGRTRPPARPDARVRWLVRLDPGQAARRHHVGMTGG